MEGLGLDVREADDVGSSITMIRASQLTARRISTFCLSAVRNGPTAASPSSSKPHRETSRRSALHPAPLKQSGATRLDAEEDVLDDGQGRGGRELLRDRRDAVATRIARGRVVDRPAVDEQLAVVGTNHAADDLSERRFAGSVRPDQRVHTTEGDLQADVIESARPGVALPDRDEPDRRDFRCAHPAPDSRSSSGSSSIFPCSTC